ncbi:putative bifunctional diguanylate cyclase/phosphodiesterase [Nitrosophilus labii]|uniref:putative bifunctional diguanylate cyclase/phosphodiesterase n=1 Tax=Nitrosophilus labii TaxID=2706014 RepID=UPI001656A6FA|nr:GGDEF domain-containing phosphodiesterase [Nitrosophilus labii]
MTNIYMIEIILIFTVISILIYIIFFTFKRSSLKIDELFNFVTNELNNILIITDKNGNQLFYNDEFNKLIKNNHSTNLNNFLKIESKKGIKEPFFDFVLKELPENKILKTVLYYNGDSLSVEIKYKIYKNRFYIFFIKELSLEERYIKNLKNSLYRDSVTNLPNNELFLETLHTTIIKSKLHNKSFMLMFIEINNYQNILNFLGIEYANKVLDKLGKILKQNLNSDTFIARISDSKFALIVNNIKTLKNFRLSLKNVIQKLDSFKIDEHEVFLSINIGATFFPYLAQDQETLIKYTNFALLEAKNKNLPLVIFSDILKEKVEKIEYIKSYLPKAIKNREFEIYFQPKLNIETDTINSAEVLIRWKQSNSKNIPPSLFIPIAEKTGDIIKIGEFTIEAAMKFLYKRKIENKPLIKLAINISQKQIKDYKIIELFSKLIEKYDIDPKYLEVEITESAIAEDEKHVLNILNSFHKLGICISLDDFGTGYSSLHYLSKLPIDKIKIDKAFIDNYENIKSRLILKNIFMIAHQLKFKTVMEGIENKEQLNLIRKLKCTQAQGYYILKPLSEKELDMFLHLSTKTCIV